MIPIPFEPIEWARQEAVMIAVRDNVPRYMSIGVLWAPPGWPCLIVDDTAPLTPRPIRKGFSTGLRTFVVHERERWMKLAS